MQKNKQIEEVFMKYSKPVIIQWLCTQYPVFFKDKKEIIRELTDCKDDIAFEKIHAEINMLIKKRNSLKPENFKDFDDPFDKDRIVKILKIVSSDNGLYQIIQEDNGQNKSADWNDNIVAKCFYC